MPIDRRDVPNTSGNRKNCTTSDVLELDYQEQLDNKVE
jgi:hypothetical protein